MYGDVLKKIQGCPECAIATGVGRQRKLPLHPIAVSHPFQIWAVDIMDLPRTKHVVVFHDLFSKWPMVYPVPDQKAVRIARLLAKEIVPVFGVPEGLLSDRGANLLSHVMDEVCSILGVMKLNTTSYHPQGDGCVERFNCTLKSMLRKHAARFGSQWDVYLYGVLWAYRNTPHASTGEKPSYLLFGLDCRSPTEAALLQVSPSPDVSVGDYREQLILSLSSARDLATRSIARAQTRYKSQYDKKVTTPQYRVRDWVLV